MTTTGTLKTDAELMTEWVGDAIECSINGDPLTHTRSQFKSMRRSFYQTASGRRRGSDATEWFMFDIYNRLRKALDTLKSIGWTKKRLERFFRETLDVMKLARFRSIESIMDYYLDEVYRTYYENHPTKWPKEVEVE